MRKHATAAAREEFEQAVFVWRQRDRRIGVADLARYRVDLDAVDFDHRVLDPGAAPIQRAQARYQLVEGEGLDQVIVGAEIEAAHAVLGLVVGGQNQHVTILAVAAQAGQYGQAVDLRQHQVENHRVVLVQRDVRKRLFSIECLVDGEALLLQAGRQRALQPLGILYE